MIISFIILIKIKILEKPLKLNKTDLEVININNNKEYYNNIFKRIIDALKKTDFFIWYWMLFIYS